MKILIVAMNYAPEVSGTAPYTTRMAESLAAEHQVRVFAGVPHYPEWRIHDGFGAWRSDTVEKSVQVVRLRHVVPSKPNAFTRLAHELTYCLRALIEARGVRPDVVVAISPPLFGAMAAKLIAKWKRVPLGVVVQDIYSAGVAELGQGGGPATAAAAWLLSRLERWVMGGQAHVCTIHELFQTRLASIRASDARITIIKNWTHVTSPNELTPRASTREQLGWGEDEVVVLHAGNMGEKQGLQNVVDAARLAESEGLPIRFVLMGNGNQRRELETLGAGVATLEFRDSVPDEGYLEALSAADVLLVNERPGVAEMSLPSKITSYCAAGRPIVAATSDEGATAEAIRRSGAGIVLVAGDPERLIRAIADLAKDTERQSELGENGKTYAEQHLSSASAMAAYRDWVGSMREAVSR